jgi:hypothetical protein
MQLTPEQVKILGDPAPMQLVTNHGRYLSIYRLTALTVHSTPSVSVFQSMPRLTTMFMGRKDILECLARFLDPSKPSVILKLQRIFVLYGLGGGGKTQIMAKFIIDFGDKYVPFRH